jgi:hypothetical protein
MDRVSPVIFKSLDLFCFSFDIFRLFLRRGWVGELRGVEIPFVSHDPSKSLTNTICCGIELGKAKI